MTNVKAIAGLLAVAVAVVGVVVFGAAQASASSAPIVITYEKRCSAGHCDGTTGNGGTITMDVTGFQATGKGARLTMTIDWGLVDKCRPDAAGPEPTCPTSTIDFGSGETPQVYCSTANPPSTPPWCTTDRSFEYVTVDGVEKTHVTETWSGFGDPTARFR